MTGINNNSVMKEVFYGICNAHEFEWRNCKEGFI